MRVTTWILGILAGITLLATIVALAPGARDIWTSIFPRPKYTTLITNDIMAIYTEIQNLKTNDWVVEDVSIDSCGNISLVFRKDR